GGSATRRIRAVHAALGEYWMSCEGGPELLFTDNETNAERLWNVPNRAPFVKDGINDAVVHGARERVNPLSAGTKAAAHYAFSIGPGRTETVLLRLSAHPSAAPFADAARILGTRAREADAFFDDIAGAELPEDARRVQRQAFAGLLWSKQYYE